MDRCSGYEEAFLAFVHAKEDAQKAFSQDISYATAKKDEAKIRHEQVLAKMEEQLALCCGESSAVPESEPFTAEASRACTLASDSHDSFTQASEAAVSGTRTRPLNMKDLKEAWFSNVKVFR